MTDPDSRPRHKSAPFATSVFPWIEQGPEDYICRLGEYVLRVEQMDKGVWWHQAYCGDEEMLLDTMEESCAFGVAAVEDRVWRNIRLEASAKTRQPSPTSTTAPDTGPATATPWTAKQIGASRTTR